MKPMAVRRVNIDLRSSSNKMQPHALLVAGSTGVTWS